jgi:hypothetical protein
MCAVTEYTSLNWSPCCCSYVIDLENHLLWIQIKGSRFKAMDK